jgi:50S ribosomal protein L16 3-hydroxylase
LLRRFAFIPYARLDDVMVSYAAPGGGVGPHVDSYDVFLLQGEGRRRWQLGRRPGTGPASARHSRPRCGIQQADLSSQSRILTPFRPEVECTLDAGDMLYLPPAYAHDGVAVGTCMTYSIGFRAPSAQELGTAFLDWLRDSIALEGRYADPSLVPSSEPARIVRSLQKRMFRNARRHSLERCRPSHVFLAVTCRNRNRMYFFEPPARPLELAAFRSAAARRGVSLDPRTQLLYDAHNVFLNGAVVDCSGHVTAMIKRLANDRRLRGASLSGPDSARAGAVALLYRWYRDGFLDLGLIRPHLARSSWRRLPSRPRRSTS